MKLVICDHERIQNFSIPKEADNVYLLNFKYNYNNTYTDEVLIFSKVSNEWCIAANDKLRIAYNNQEVKQIAIKENNKIDLYFANLPESVSLYIYPDLSTYIPYEIKEEKQIIIGSTNDSTIKYSANNKEKITIAKTNEEWYVQRTNMQPTSTYLNSKTYQMQKINASDIIFVNGMKFIFMGNYIMINSFNQSITTSLNQISYKNINILENITKVNDLEKNIKLFNDNQLFVHTPRMRNQIEPIKITIEDAPASEQQGQSPIIFTLISQGTMLMTSGLTLMTSLRNYTTGQTTAFNFIVELITAGGMFVSSFAIPIIVDRWSKHNMKKRERLRQKKYTAYLNEKAKFIEEIKKKQEEILKFNNTSLEQIITNITRGDSEIWSREIFDNDFLSTVLGIGVMPAQIEVEAPKKTFSLSIDPLQQKAIDFSTKDLMLKNVPVTYSIIENRVMPLIISPRIFDDYVKSIMLQIIYYHSGNDLKIVTITSKENEDKWEFMKFLPHSWDVRHERRFFASNNDELLPVSSYLEHIYNERLNNKSVFNEYYLIVTDNFKLAREMSVVNKILESNDNLGFSLAIFETSIKDIPSRFNTLINIGENEGTIVNRTSSNNSRISFKPNYINNLNIENYANILSNIPISIGSADSKIPNHVTFLEMFNVGKIEQLNLVSRWHENNPVSSLKTIVGFKENNTEIELDLHEKYHGPHGLIAGTTGSGKSEFIISYILSLAVNYHPYEVQFVLIDYKGGGLAGAFENRETGLKLPHLVGTITNLDVSEMNRTLVSINSELKRRQRVFNETREALEEGTVDIYKYQQFYRDGKVSEPMSHLFIISDEFAELKDQQPDFMDELISAARIGRSLGVHLILATQKPSGVVNDQIWSNTRFRVCLKVQSPEDSQDMLKKPDAAYIRGSGRFYLQVGEDEIYELGQSGWSGAKYIPSDTIQKKLNDDIHFLSNNGEHLKTVNEQVKKEETQEQGEQLTNVVKYISDVATRENIKLSNLWLPNIPEQIYYDDIIKKYNIKSNKYFIDSIIGEYDDPANQRQGCVHLPLSSCGNTYIAGSSGSGKSTLLSTIVYSTIINHNASAVNFYIIDLGNEKLKIYSKAPQVGEVLTGSNPDKVKFLFYMLNDEKNKRFSYYSENGRDFDKDVREEKCPFPTIIVMINDFDVFKERFEDIYEDVLSSFTRNCAKVGIIFIVTSTQTNSLGYACQNNFPKKIAMNFADSSDYSMMFEHSPIPKKNAGRGVIEVNNWPFEFQASLIFKEEQEDKINYVVNQLNKYLPQKANKVPTIPDEVTIEWLKPKIKSLSRLPIGVNIQTAQLGIYNFDRLMSVMTSKDYTVMPKFFPKFVDILNNIKDLRIIVINSIKDVKVRFNDNIKYCDGNFKSIISTIDTNVKKCLAEKKDAKFMIVFLGYAALQKNLEKAKNEDDEVITIDDLISSCKPIDNFKYIVYDEEKMTSMLDDGKLSNEFKHNSAIWLGKSFDEQEIIELDHYYSNSENLTNNNVVIVENGIAQFIKY